MKINIPKSELTPSLTEPEDDPPTLPPKRPIVWTDQQKQIFDWFEHGSGHLVIRARAGSGKSASVIEGIERAPEERVLLTSFMASAVDELRDRLRTSKAVAATLHSVGMSFIKAKHPEANLSKFRGKNIAGAVVREYAGKQQGLGEPLTANGEIIDCVARLATLGKEIAPLVIKADHITAINQLSEIACEYDCLPDPGKIRLGWNERVIAYLALVSMRQATNLGDASFDFADMIFLPIVNDWIVGRYDLVVCDEAQDMSPFQLILARRVLKHDGRMVCVGDPAQAIFGWRGADTGSLDRMKTELGASELNLTVTQRCPRLVVEIARTIVPDIDPRPDAEDGLVKTINYDELSTLAQPGDAVLSRTNAPLMGACLQILRAGKQAAIVGRDFGEGLAKIIDKVTDGENMRIADFLPELYVYQQEQIERIQKKYTSLSCALGNEDNKNRSHIVRLTQEVNDKCDTLRALAAGEEVKNTRWIQFKLQQLYADKGFKKTVRCSTVHRMKGREADRVFVLEDTLYMFGKRFDQEEKNIAYVAMTRSRRELYLVKGL